MGQPSIDDSIPMLRTLDRYIIRQFLGTFFFILVLIMLVAVVFDVSEKTQDFAKATATLPEIVMEYYVNFVLYYANLFSGLLIFLAVLLFTSRLGSRSEVIAILSSGVSFPRFLLPYFVAATFLTVVSLLVNHLLLPKANEVRLAFEEAYFRHTFSVKDQHLHREIAPGTIAYFETFNAQRRTGYRFSLEQWRDGALLSKVHAERAEYDSVNNRWAMYDYNIRMLDPAGDRLQYGQRLDTLIPLKPSDLGQRWENAMAMATPEIDRYVAMKRAQGDDSVMPYLIEKHQRTSYPFATYVFTLIGVSIASRKVRGGIGVHLALGVLLILMYIFAMKITTVASTNAGFNPFLAVWLPNLVFGVIGVWIYLRAPK